MTEAQKDRAMDTAQLAILAGKSDTAATYAVVEMHNLDPTTARGIVAETRNHPVTRALLAAQEAI